jgi:hypothetical protein
LVTLGYFIFPLVEDTKIPPEGMYWRSMASNDINEATSWWTKFPNDNVGIDCGKSAILVIDLDSEEAADRWDEIWDEHEDSGWDDGRYPVVETRRGWHVYFEQPDHEIGNPKQHRLGEGIDVKGVGGMVVGPGSVIGGHDYALVRGDLAKVPPLPHWLDSMVRPRARSAYATRLDQRKRDRQLHGWGAKHLVRQAVNQISHAPPGHRNDRLNTWAYQLREVELDGVDVFDELMHAAQAAGLSKQEARATIRSGLGRGPWV